MSDATIYFVAGERSGDNHGAALLKALRARAPKMQFLGRGGPKMRTIAGGKFLDWIDDTAVVGLWEVIRRYPFFRKQFQATISEIDAAQPSAVVLIDYPGFNLRLARALRAKLSELKIIYYISPQVWAWNRGRIKKMARFLDLVLCIFPFEADLYNKSGLHAIFVGHPMLERLRSRRIDIDRDPNLIGLFPGSRLPEVRKIFPVMLESVRELRKRNRNVHFEVAAASQELAVGLTEILDRHARDRQVAQIKVGETAAIMQRASAGIVASGSATLEAAYFRLPFVLIYKVAWPTYLAARLVVKVKHLGMPNVLAEREIVPEFIQHRARPEAVAKAVWQLMENADARERMISEFDVVVGKLGKGEASEKAAGTIIEEIGRST